MKIELCCGSLGDAITAYKNGADRVELCSCIYFGGLTPSPNALTILKEKTGIETAVMIRPREGGFCYDETEFELMLHDGDEMMEMIDAINHPLYQACLDTGHLGLQDGYQYETIKRLGSHLRGLHVQDNFGSLPVPATNRMWRQDLHLPPLMGSVDFDEVMIGLKEIGYDGLFNLEPESPRCGYLRSSDYCKEERLKTINRDLAMEYYACVYDIAKHILTCYDVFEE